MKSGVYKHKNNTDVAMRVIKSYWIPEKDGWSMKVNWVNIVNPNNQFIIQDKTGPFVEKVFVPRSKVLEWEPYDVSL